MNYQAQSRSKSLQLSLKSGLEIDAIFQTQSHKGVTVRWLLGKSNPAPVSMK